MSNPLESKSILDRVIEATFPRWAQGRYAARARLAAGRHVLGEYYASYRGAVATRTSTTWGQSTSYRGGSTKDRHDLGKMRDRARGAYRENVIAHGLLNTETDNVVAEGFTLQMQTGSEAFNAEAEDRFYAWLERADVTGQATASDLFRMSWRESRKDGDGGFILLTRGGYPYLQYIPGDLIRNPYGSYDYKTMFDGVECDPAGRPVRFWVRDVDESGTDIVTPIDARDFVYLCHRTDPLAIRGETVYSSIFQHLDQFDAYVDAVTKTAIMACIFGLIEKRNKPASVLGMLGTEANSKGEQQKAITLDKGGMLKVLGTDESVFQVQAQQPMQQTPDFMRALFRVICLAFQMPLEIGQKDLSQVNFSGGQLGMKDYERSCRIKQDWLKSRCWNRVAFWWLSIERRRQQLGYPDAFVTPFPTDYGTFELHAREWLLRDRMGEAKAALMEYAIGVNNPLRECAARAVDYKQNRRDFLRHWEANEADGLPNVLPTDTRDALPPAPEPADTNPPPPAATDDNKGTANG